MVIRTILPATTDAANSDTFSVDEETVTVTAYNLAGAEVAILEIAYDGTNFHQVYEDGSVIQLTATNNTFTVQGPGLYRIAKGATAGAAAIHTAS